MELTRAAVFFLAADFRDRLGREVVDFFAVDFLFDELFLADARFEAVVRERDVELERLLEVAASPTPAGSSIQAKATMSVSKILILAVLGSRSDSLERTRNQPEEARVSSQAPNYRSDSNPKRNRAATRLAKVGFISIASVLHLSSGEMSNRESGPER
ncbi:MAG: hypothetical protein R2729_22515 [Bryobacteraceae bacterium]